MFYLIIVVNLIQSIECAMEPYIVEGQEASLRHFPHSALMYMSCLSTKSSWRCGSSILNKRVVLTAAHCLTSCAERPRTITVFTGHRLAGKGWSTTVSNFYIHEVYNGEVSNVFDIALARLKTDAQLGQLVKRVALLMETPDDEYGEVAGWGVTDENVGIYAHALYYCKQRILKRPECKRRIRNLPHGTICGDGDAYPSGLLGFIACEKKPLIAGGNIAKIEDFPHSALMVIQCKVYHDEVEPFMCGASILNARVALSAAHCLADCGSGSKASISVGRNIYGGQMASVKRYFIHEHYDGVVLINDIVLVNLKTSLKFGSKVKRVALMAKPPYSVKATVAGWGLIDEETSEESPYLHYVNQYVLPPWECQVIFGEMSTGTLCAGSRNENSYASMGDSGSALVVRGYIQIGVVSYKIPKISRSLVVYTDTGYFYEWIVHHTKRLYCA